MKLMQTALAAATTAESDVVILPVGKWQTDKYGEVDLSREITDEIIANFADNVLGRRLRVDTDHEFAAAAGWLTGLGYGTFADPVTGKVLDAVVMRVDWTPGGMKSLAEKEYLYVSAAYGSYTQPSTGKVFRNVLRAISLTNDPVMVVPPLDTEPLSVEFSELVTLSDMLKFGEVVDNMRPDEASAPDLEAAEWGTWPAFDSIRQLIREAIDGGVEGDALRARIAELSLDLPAAIEKAITEAVAAANAREVAEAEADATGTPETQTDPFNPSAVLADPPADSGSDPVAELLASYDALMTKCDAIVRGTAGVTSMRTLASETRKKLADLLSKKGGTTAMSEAETKLAEERDAAVKQLADIKRTQRNTKIDEALKALTAKGLTQPALNMLAAICKSDTPDAILLSEGAAPVEMPDALLKLAEIADFVPVAKTPEELRALENGAGAVTLSESEKARAKANGVTEEIYLAAKIDRLAKKTEEED